MPKAIGVALIRQVACTVAVTAKLAVAVAACADVVKPSAAIIMGRKMAGLVTLYFNREIMIQVSLANKMPQRVHCSTETNSVIKLKNRENANLAD